MSKPYFPMFVDLTDKKVVVVGAGTIAKRRIRTLIEFTDHLVVIAPEDIHSACRCLGITVNVCSDKNKCDFYFPGIAIRDNLVAGVTASGKDHKAARAAVEKIREIL